MGTIYLKITDRKGVAHIEQCEAWDEAKFLASVIEQYAKNKNNPSRVEVVTRLDWLMWKEKLKGEINGTRN